MDSKTFTMESKYFTINIYKYIHARYDMHNSNRFAMEESYARSSECENEVLHQ